MTGKEEQRMIHIRIDRSVHRDLRLVAAEYDLTIQDIVAEAVEKRVDSFAEGDVPVQKSYTLEIEDAGEESPSILGSNGDPQYASVLRRIEGKLDKLSSKVDEIGRRLDEN